MHTPSSDDNPRPLKRQRIESIQDTDKDASNAQNLNSIPCSTLLLALPSILIHPPMHPHHQTSLQLSSAALKKCLELPEIEKDLECRAWTALAEVGIIEGTQEPGKAEEVEKAISKAVRTCRSPYSPLIDAYIQLLIAQKVHHAFRMCDIAEICVAPITTSLQTAPFIAFRKGSVPSPEQPEARGTNSSTPFGHFHFIRSSACDIHSPSRFDIL